jgi:chemotaxis protein CheX
LANPSPEQNNKKILIPFLKAGIKVLSELTNVTFNKKEVYPLKGNKSVGDVKIEIPVVGDIETRVVFDFPRSFAFKLAKLMVGEMAQEADVELLQSAILEVGNMISGNAMGFLEELNIDCDIEPPKAMIGKNMQVFSPQSQIGVIEFTSEIGDFNIYILLKEEKILDPAGILLFNITDIISNYIVEYFIPKGFSVYSTSDLDMALQILDKKEVVLVFMNQIHNYNISLEDQVSKMKDKNPNIRIVFYSTSGEWNQPLFKKFNQNILGYIPRAFDSARTAKALIMILDKIGIKYNQKRKHVRVRISSDDKVMGMIYKKNEDGELDIVNAKVKDLSIGGALLEMDLKDAEQFKEQEIISRCQLKLKGSMVRSTAQIMKKVEGTLGVSFMDMDDDDVKKISYFIHNKMKELVKP